MTPRDAGAVSLDEPDWRARYDALLVEHPDCDFAFEITLREWRRHHAEMLPNGKRQPASAIDGMIALAHLDIVAPRSLVQDMPRGGALYQEQHDDHCWLISFAEGRAWRIDGMEEGRVYLECFGEQKSLELTPKQWANYNEKAQEWLKACWPEASA